MELDDLKNTWRAYDAKLEKSMKLNMHILKIMDLDKTRTALKKFIMTPFLGVIIGIVLQVMLGSFIYAGVRYPRRADLPVRADADHIRHLSILRRITDRL